MNKPFPGTHGQAVGIVERFISGLRLVAIPRIEDLPYSSSPPIQFCYEVTAPLLLGAYTFTGVAGALAIARPLSSNVLYYFRSISVSADISELDFQAAITVTPNFQLYKQSEGGIQLFREPLRIGKYYDQLDYRLVWQTQAPDDILTASIVGTLTQIPALIGKVSVTMKVVIAAQEIIDSGYIKLFRRAYPDFDRDVASSTDVARYVSAQGEI